MDDPLREHEALLDQLELELEGFSNIPILYDREVWRTDMRRRIQAYLDVYNNMVTDFAAERFKVLITIVTNEQHRIACSELTMSVLQTFLRMANHRGSFYQWFPPGESLTVVLGHANDLEFDFWGVRRGTGGLAEQFNPVAECYSSENRWLNVGPLLQHGFRYACPQAVYVRRCRGFQNGLYGIGAIGNPRRVELMLKHNNPFKMMLIMDTFSAFAADTPYGRWNRIKSLACIYRSIPHRYVTSGELRSELLPVTTRARFDFIHDVARMYREFRNLPHTRYFDQRDDNIQPRPVMHLCRCKIRDVLAANLGLPNGIEDFRLPGIPRLRLPDRIKGYLRLEI